MAGSISWNLHELRTAQGAEPKDVQGRRGLLQIEPREEGRDGRLAPGDGEQGTMVERLHGQHDSRRDPSDGGKEFKDAWPNGP